MTTLGIFSRLPEPGATKTRLAADIGDALAARLAEAFLKDTAGRLDGVAARLVIAVTPPTAAARDGITRLVPAPVTVTCQRAGNLGERITAFFDDEFRGGAERVVLIGADSPDLPRSLVVAAFERLRERSVVLAPADDGGFVLLGVSDPRGLERASAGLAAVRWGTETVLDEVCHALQAAGAVPELLSAWSDVDTLSDLRRLDARLSATAVHPAAAGDDCVWTRRVLKDLRDRITRAG